jgi:hypothetical protein
MWLAWDLEKTYFPVPVFLNRFAAALFVLIFGIDSLLFHRFRRGGSGQKQRWREQIRSAHATLSEILEI